MADKMCPQRTKNQERCGVQDLMTAWLTFQKHANNVVK